MDPPVSAELSSEVRRWLIDQQLRSGAFPDTTSSSFVYSRGTGKVFEVLAASHDAPDAEDAAAAALGWLLGMQYRPDSMFFIPSEHRDRAVSYTHLDVYKRQGRRPKDPLGLGGSSSLRDSRAVQEWTALSPCRRGGTRRPAPMK